MKEVFLGEVIRQRRLELGLTQENLCEGICEPITISRLENGKQTPSRNRIKALLQRLGLPDDRFYGLLSVNELQIISLEKEIVSCHVRFDRSVPEERSGIRKEAFEKHRELENAMEKDDTLSRQLILRSRYLLGTESGSYSFEDGLAILLEAMHLTSPRFNLEKIGEGLYTENEIKLINNIAQCYIRAEKHHDAIAVLSQLLYYLKSHLQKIPPNRTHIPLVSFNYARELEIVHRYDEAMKIADYARKICVDYGHYEFLPDLIAILAECHYHKGSLSESAELYRQAFYLYKVMDDTHNRAIIQAEARDFLNLILE